MRTYLFASSLSKFIKRLIHIFLDSLSMMGKNPIIVPTIAIKATFRLDPKNKYEITNAATANAIPTP